MPRSQLRMQREAIALVEAMISTVGCLQLVVYQAQVPLNPNPPATLVLAKVPPSQADKDNGWVRIHLEVARNHDMEFDTNRREGKSLARQPKQPNGELLQLVGFHVGGEEFVIDILRVQEIIRTQQLTRVPNSPECMEGVMNLRGKIIPVIALRKRFGLEEIAPDKQNRIVVVEIQGTVLGFVVDAVSEVLRIPADTVEPPPRLGPVDREYVAGVGKLGDRLLIVLDADRLMSGSEQGMAGTAVDQT